MWGGLGGMCCAVKKKMRSITSAGASSLEALFVIYTALARIVFSDGKTTFALNVLQLIGLRENILH